MSNDKTRPGGRVSAGDEDSTYQVGYRKPPRHTQWQQGQSSNPQGRPQNSLSLKTIARILADELSESVSVQGPNGTRKISKQEAYFKKLINDALTGDARDKKILLDAMFRLAALPAPIEEGAPDNMFPGGDDALERHVQRAIRRKDLEVGASAEDDGAGSP